MHCVSRKHQMQISNSNFKFQIQIQVQVQVNVTQQSRCLLATSVSSVFGLLACDFLPIWPTNWPANVFLFVERQVQAFADAQQETSQANKLTSKANKKLNLHVKQSHEHLLLFAFATKTRLYFVCEANATCQLSATAGAHQRIVGSSTGSIKQTNQEE